MPSPTPSQSQVTQMIAVGMGKKNRCLWTFTLNIPTLFVKRLPTFLFPVFLIGSSSTPEMQNSCANSDPTWREYLRQWGRGSKQQAGRHQHLLFCLWEGDTRPFPCCFGPHLNQTCSLPSNLFSSLLSCFQVSWFCFILFGFAVWFWKAFDMFIPNRSYRSLKSCSSVVFICCH